jgi:hypothetical protein
MDYFLEVSAFLSSAFDAAGLAGFASLFVSALGASFFLANFISSFGASALAGVVAAGLAAGVAVWANAVNDSADRITIANVFILSFLCVNEVDFVVYIYITYQTIVSLT